MEDRADYQVMEGVLGLSGEDLELDMELEEEG